MLKHFTGLLIVFVTFGCKPAKINRDDKSYVSETLEMHKISDHVYQHISFLNTQSFGRVSCNGMVVFDKNEAIVFDTPTDNDASAELINWIENNLHCKVKAIIPTHFHADCVAGLEVFHKRNIPSYANHSTIASARSRQSAVPQKGFDHVLELPVGSQKVIARFIGEGHTRDNIIGYFPGDKIMFGGCLIKEVGAGKGNLEDANVNAWPATVTQLKEQYPDTKTVVPGHGKAGTTELLDYTIKLFEQP